MAIMNDNARCRDWLLDSTATGIGIRRTNPPPQKPKKTRSPAQPSLRANLLEIERERYFNGDLQTPGSVESPSRTQDK